MQFIEWRACEACWKGEYKAALVWNAIRPKQEKVRWNKLIWVAHVLLKHAIIAWLVVLNRLPTKDRRQVYTTYKCSPLVSTHTNATLTLNNFEAGGDGGGPSECDNQYHSDDELVVALSTGWFDNEKRCLKYINIHGNGRSVRAKVVDECDSTMGCDADHDYQPPCANNIVDASKVVWKALGMPKSQWGGMDIYWSDADD
ncbi:hypothetical protein DITRI_Ditri01bG0134700 [Diplodiscus trichospermus]